MVIKLRRLRWVGHIVCMGEWRNALKILVGKLLRSKAFWRHRHRLMDNVQLDLKEVGDTGTDWIHLAQDRVHWWAVVNT